MFSEVKDMGANNRNVALYCPVCGNDQFFCLDEEIDGVSDAPDEVRVQCADCKAIFTKEELLESNQDVINANIEDVAQELIKVFEKKLKKMLK